MYCYDKLLKIHLSEKKKNQGNDFRPMKENASLCIKKLWKDTQKSCFSIIRGRWSELQRRHRNETTVSFLYLFSESYTLWLAEK